MGKKYYDIADFLEDATFRDWVLQKDSGYQKKWEAYMAEHPEMTPTMQLAKAVVSELELDRKPWDSPSKANAKASIMRRIGASERKLGRQVENTHHPAKSISWLKAAVISFLLVGAGLAGWFGMNGQQNAPIAVQTPAWVERSNHAGQKSIVHLPDGSKVTMNSASSIRYQSDFGKATRELELVGEAFFEVKKDAKKPFRVVTGDVTTTALGTSFTVTAFEGQRPSVKLATGIVEVVRTKEEDEESVKLVPGEEAFFGRDETMKKRTFDLSSAFLWKEGILFFDKTPFSEVVDVLERWYAVDIEVHRLPKSRVRLVSGRFDNDHLDNVLQSIGYSLGFSYEIEQKQVTITFR